MAEQQNNKHTLFSFATLRSPQLLTDDIKNLFFIRTSATVEKPGPSDGWTLTPGYEQRKELLIGLLGQPFYDFSEWLIRNRVSAELNTSDYSSKGTALPDELNSDQQGFLWSFLLQAAEDNDFRMHDILYQLLLANHYLHHKGESVDLRDLAFSKLVLPKEFFPAEEDHEGSTTTGRISSPGLEVLRRKVTVLNSRKRIELLKTLLSFLEKSKAEHDKSEDRRYFEARREYDATVETLWKTQRTENTGVFDRENETTDSLEQPDLPVFSFLQGETIFDHPHFYDLLPEGTATEATLLNLADSANYEDAIQTLNFAINRETQTVFENTDMTGTVVVAGGQVLPATNDPYASIPLYGYSAYLEKMLDGKYKAIIVMNTGADTSVDSVLYAKNGEANQTRFILQQAENLLFLTFFEDGDIRIADMPLTIAGKITLDEGGEAEFSIRFRVKGSVEGLLDFKTSAGDEGEGGDGGDGGSGGGGTETPVINRFGIKRAGIADYRKVEQEVCCWDLGEVSHIENIMAREYKERSTRRLRRTEDTVTTENSTETESLTDTSSTDRFEMQKQTAIALSESTSMGINAGVSFDTKLMRSFVNGNYANNTSQQQSNSEAVQLSKEITQKASEKILQKVREERISKMIDEFEEQNKHGYDNREGDQHVSAVYRWVDKIYKNQIFNYGKRLMYEFMIPQPALFHNAAMKSFSGTAGFALLQKPVDPRTGSGDLNLSDFSKLDAYNYKYWAAMYDAEVKPMPDQYTTIGKSFDHYTANVNEGSSKSGNISIPEGYETEKALIVFAGMAAGVGWDQKILASIGNRAQVSCPGRIDDFSQHYFNVAAFTKEIPAAVNFCNFHLGCVNFSVKCRLTEKGLNDWKIETFNAIMKAYEQKLADYEAALSETVKGTNPGFYRTIENAVLRKSCISYLTKDNEMGASRFVSGNDVMTIEPKKTAEMEKYASLVKFMEQAFEWEILSYTFYPFYWADKNDWQANYQQDVDDPIFRAFLQSGMARAMVSVRPGFEEAVMYYIATGEVWLGGEPPVIGDDLYLSIVEELKHPEYYIEETWETRVPTTLNIIQKGGTEVDVDGLPCKCGSDSLFTRTNTLLERAAQS